MRLPSSNFLVAIRSATTAAGLATTALTTARSVAASAACEQIGVEVLDQFLTEAKTSLVRLRGSLQGGMRAWGRSLAAGLERGFEASTALIDRAGRQAISRASQYALEFAQRKAYAVAGVIDIALGAPQAFEQALQAAAHSKAQEHIQMFRSAVSSIEAKVRTIQTAIALTEGRSEEDNLPYHNFDFEKALKTLKLAEVSLARTPPASSQSVGHIDSAMTLLATGRPGSGAAADTEALLAIFTSGGSREAALEFLDMPGTGLVDLVERGIEQEIFAPIEAAYIAASEIGPLIETAAKEYGLALEWIDRLRAVENVVALTREALSGARTDFFITRALARIRSVIVKVEEFNVDRSNDVGEFRFEIASELFQIRTEMTAFSGSNTEALAQIRADSTGTLAPGQVAKPRLFEKTGQGTVNRMEVLLRLLMATVGRVTGRADRAGAVEGLLQQAIIMADEALEALGPAPEVPPAWSTVLMLMREAGVDRPVDEIMTGEFAHRAIDSYRTLSEGWRQVGQLRLALKKKDQKDPPPKIPCAPPQLAAAPALAERAVGLRISRERIDQLRSTTAIDVLAAGRTLTAGRVFSLDRITNLITTPPAVT